MGGRAHAPYPPEFRRRMVELVGPGGGRRSFRVSLSRRPRRLPTGCGRRIWTRGAATTG